MDNRSKDSKSLTNAAPEVTELNGREAMFQAVTTGNYPALLKGMIDSSERNCTLKYKKEKEN